MKWRDEYRVHSTTATLYTMAVDLFLPVGSEVQPKRKRSEQPASSAPPPPRKRLKRDAGCPVCLGRVPASDLIQLEECDCLYCRQCLKETFRIGSDHAYFPATCCGQSLAVETYKSVLPKTLVKEYQRQMEVQDGSPPLYCTNSDCRRHIPAASIRDKFGICGSCHISTCRCCKVDKAEHLGAFSICPQNEDLLDALAILNGWKRCPKCAIMIEKTTKCNDVRWVTLQRHIHALTTSRCYCRSEWCWTCMKSIRGPSGCQCHFKTAVPSVQPEDGPTEQL